MNSFSYNFPPGKALETAIRTALVEEETLYRQVKNWRLARERKPNYTFSSINRLNLARDVNQGVLDSSAEVVSALNAFVDHLSSVIWLYESEQMFGDLHQLLPSTDAAKRRWKSMVVMVEKLLVKIESLKSTTSYHTECMVTKLEAHKRIARQNKIFLDSLTQSIDALAHSMGQKRIVLHPIRRLPTEILEQIFEFATLHERSTLQGNLIGRQTSHTSIETLYCTVPRIPTILASTCRRWRTIALNLTRLWTFLRAPTLERYGYTAGTRECVVGLSTFQRAKLYIRTSECEVVVGPTDDWSMTKQHLSSIPASQISTMNIISPLIGLDLSQIPTARVLRIIREGTFGVSGTIIPPPSYPLPIPVLANTRELDFHHALPAVNTPILSVTSFSLSFNKNACFLDLGHSLANFPNLTAVVLSANIDTLHRQMALTPLHHSRIRTLSITDTVIPHLYGLLKRGALSLPSLTHFILLDICPSYHNKGGWGHLQSLFVNVTRFDIRAATQQNCGSNIRKLLDVMPRLQQFTLFDNAVDDGLRALLIGPIKRIRKLVVSDSKTDGSNVKSYYDALSSEATVRPDHNPDVSIQFVNCPCVLPQIRETTFPVDK